MGQYAYKVNNEKGSMKKELSIKVDDVYVSRFNDKHTVCKIEQEKHYTVIYFTCIWESKKQENVWEKDIIIDCLKFIMRKIT